MAIHPDENQSAGVSGERELFWLAFCYVAGELSDIDAEEFEVRLEADQAAREAVAQAVELAAAAESASGLLADSVAAPQAFCQSTSQPAAVQLSTARSWLAPTRSWLAPAGGWALAVAASLAFAIAGYSRLGREAPAAPSAETNQLDQELAGGGLSDRGLADRGLADAGLADTWAASSWGGGPLVDRERGLAFDFDFLSDEGPAGDGELLVSDWLLEAVSAAQNVPAAESSHREG